MVNLIKKFENIIISFLAVFIAFLIGGAIILYLGENPLEAYSYLFKGAFIGKKAIARTLLEATPMIFTGLAVLFGFKGGMFNIGAQGQVIMSGLIAGGMGGFIANHFINNTFVVLLVAVLGGFIWAGIAGVLKAKLGIHEVISTIMLNYIAMSLEQYGLNYPLKQGGPLGPNPQTPPVMIQARLSQLMPDTRTPFNTGFIIAVIAVIVVWFILEKTVFGYEIKAVGNNPTASENAGINVKRVVILTMALSGLIAGFAGAERVLGGATQYVYRQGLMATYGFDGIAVALLGKNNPIGVFFAAILFAVLRVGGSAMQFNTNVPSQIVIMIQAIIILLIAADNMFRMLIERRAKN